MGWFKRKPKAVAAADVVPPAPYEQSKYDWGYRIERIIEIAEIWDQTLAYTASRVDKWVIRETTAQIGDDPETTRYIPTPLWDDEWMMTREWFLTREQAEAYVSRVGGTLIEQKDA